MVFAVYPRVGGGTPPTRKGRTTGLGLSPRGRGNRGVQRGRLPGGGSIPAWAGEPDGVVQIGMLIKVYPRVGGGTSSPSARNCTVYGLSPRGRGNPAFNLDVDSNFGSIPAWAGEPGRRILPKSGRRVYPHDPILCRSIPAWAGEPQSAACGHPLHTVYPRVGGGTL